MSLDISATTSTAIKSSLEYTPNSTPNPLNVADDEFDSVNFPESALDTAGTRFANAEPWSWQNQSTATAVIAQGSVILTAPASASDNFRLLTQSAPVGAWKYRAKFSSLGGASSGFNNFGLALLNGGNDRMFFFGPTFSGSWGIEGSYWSDLQTYGGFALGISDTCYFDIVLGTKVINFPHFLEIESDATTLFFRYSVSGANGTFMSIGSEPIADHVQAVTDIGIALNAATNAVGFLSCDWFRRVA